MSKTCFFISPIGAPDSTERSNSNKLLNFIIEPVLAKCGYEKAVRADQMTQPGVITSQVFTKLLNDDLVIADLTGGNANVFYELAVRHMLRKPCIHMIRQGEKLPFDVAPNRTITFDFDIQEANRVKDELEAMILSAGTDPAAVQTPLSFAIQLAPLDKSNNPLEVGMTEILALVQDIRAIVGVLQPSPDERQGEKGNRGQLAIGPLKDAVKLVPVDGDSWTK